MARVQDQEAGDALGLGLGCFQAMKDLVGRGRAQDSRPEHELVGGIGRSSGELTLRELDVQQAARLVGPLDQQPELEEDVAFVTEQRALGDPDLSEATRADLRAGVRQPGGLNVLCAERLEGAMEGIELHPHFQRNERP